MSAVFTPYGLFAPRHYTGGQVTPFGLRGGIASGYNTSIGIGDPVKLLTTGTYALSAAGDTAGVSAVFAGWNPEDASVYEKTYWLANTTYVKIPVFLFYPVEDVMFSIQAGATLAQSALGDAADHVAGTINANSGRSGAYLGTLVGATATWKVRGLRTEPGNEWGDAFPVVEVSVNERAADLTQNSALT